jgi:hypothetical protein
MANMKSYNHSSCIFRAPAVNFEADWNNHVLEITTPVINLECMVISLHEIASSWKNSNFSFEIEIRLSPSHLSTKFFLIMKSCHILKKTTNHWYMIVWINWRKMELSSMEPFFSKFENNIYNFQKNPRCRQMLYITNLQNLYSKYAIFGPTQKCQNLQIWEVWNLHCSLL